MVAKISPRVTLVPGICSDKITREMKSWSKEPSNKLCQAFFEALKYRSLSNRVHTPCTQSTYINTYIAIDCVRLCKCSDRFYSGTCS